MKNKKNLDLIAEVGIIIASINLGFFMVKSFEPSFWNLVITIVMLLLAIWLKNKD